MGSDARSLRFRTVPQGEGGSSNQPWNGGEICSADSQNAGGASNGQKQSHILVMFLFNNRISGCRWK